MASISDAILFCDHYLPTVREAYSSSVLLRPRRPRQFLRRVGLPTGSASLEILLATGAGVGVGVGIGVDSTDVLNTGGLGAERETLLLSFEDDPFVPPTRRRVGVRRILESVVVGVAVDSRLSDADGSGVSDLRVRDAAGRRVRVLVSDELDREAESGFRTLERRAVAALVAALSSPLGEAASSETSARELGRD